MCGHLTEKVDVFAFGVVALEILSGGPNSDSSLEQEKVYLLEWAWHLHENNKALDLATPMLRPPISRVLAMLSRDIEVSSVTSKPGYITDWQLNEIPSFVSKDTSGPSTEWTSSSRQNTVEFKNSSYWAFLRVTLSTHSA
ncbi:hypothetical protein MRB53_020780 [Persea americana]|uniref:Uncharacterized protein n=1 Tax=Persea americana TaxID=3435 RepID=A0ACC2L2H8_PERAE|nr:hypothetical protein MRB53_020780 [Persea americana]